MDATIYIYTYKEGLLSKLAHDLRLTLTRFEINVQGAQVTGRFEPTSLRIDGAIRAGKLARDELSESDKQKIRDHLLRDVLRNNAQEARFVGHTQSQKPPFSLHGELTLAGVTRALSFVLNAAGERLSADFEIAPSHWGIRPFRALGGTLKVQDRVRISISADAAWLSAGAELNPAVQLVWQPNLSRPSIARSTPPSR